MESLAWLFAGVVLGIVWHEAGHALCAVLMRMPILRIVLGLGPLLASWHLGSARVELCAIPFGGAVYFWPRPFRRPAMAFVVVGGVLGNLALVGGIAILDANGLVGEDARYPLTMVVLAQFVLVVINLLPQRGRSAGGTLDTDGLQLLKLLRPRLSAREAAQAMARAHAESVGRYRDPAQAQSEPSVAWLRMALDMANGDGWSSAAARHKILKAFKSELARGGLRPEEELHVLDTLLTYGLVCGDADFRPHLDAWSARALELGGKIRTVIASRGSVLVELDQYEAGKAMLAPLLQVLDKAGSDGVFDQLMTQLYLARAECALGNASDADALAAAARATAKAMPSNPMMSHIATRFARELGAS